MNSLIRGHSGVRLVFFKFTFSDGGKGWLIGIGCFRWELIEKMKELLSAQITPVVPLRGSISASGGKHIPAKLQHTKPY